MSKFIQVSNLEKIFLYALESPTHELRDREG